MRLNTGSGFGPEQDWGDGFSWAQSISYTYNGQTSHQLIDVNGDGLPDNIWRQKYGSNSPPHKWDGFYHVRLNTGSGFGPEQDWGEGFSWDDYIGNGNYGKKHQLVDMNGDGLPDDVWRYKDTSNPLPHDDGTYRVRPNQTVGKNLLASVTLPTGGSIAYAYSSSAQSDHRDLTGKPGLSNPMWLVTAVTVDDGLGETNSAHSTTFSYKGGYRDAPTCEFRGFREITQTDPTGASTVTMFRQDDGVWGRIAAVNRYDSSGGLLQTISNAYTNTDMDHGIVWPKLESESRYQYDGSHAPLVRGKALVYDAYGNVASESRHQIEPQGLPNNAPQVTATAASPGVINTPVNLGGTVIDDDLPLPATLATQWSVVNGPGSVSFADATAVETTASFSVSGTYTLRLTATDGALPQWCG